MIADSKDSPLSAWRTPAPIASDAPGSAGSFGIERSTATGFPERLAGLSILIVDDLPANADALRELLRLEGARAEVAGGARAALERMASEQYDVVISDLAMPAMSGLEMVEQMRASGRNARTPAIAYTGYGDVHDARQSGGAGFDRHLTKPATLDRFVETILALVRPAA